jgi:hypothetical protein
VLAEFVSVVDAVRCAVEIQQQLKTRNADLSLRLNPKFSSEIHKERAPIKDPAVLERRIAALRKVGLK